MGRMNALIFYGAFALIGIGLLIGVVAIIALVIKSIFKR